MTISEAIKNAKKEGCWSIVPYEPTSVRLDFAGKDNPEDSTELDLWSSDPERELEDLWNSLCREFESDPEAVLSVEAYGYISD